MLADKPRIFHYDIAWEAPEDKSLSPIITGSEESVPEEEGGAAGSLALCPS